MSSSHHNKESILTTELHDFSDSLKDAFAARVHLRIDFTDNND